MTGRERLLRILDGERSDVIPVAPFIHLNYVRSFLGRREIEPIRETIQVYKHFGFDIIHRNCTAVYDDVNLAGEGWEAETSIESDDRGETTITIVHTPDGDLRQVWRLNWVSEYDAESSPVEYLIKTERDLDFMMTHQPPVGDVDTSPVIAARAAVGDDGIVAPWMQGAFNHAAFFFRSPEELMVDALTNPEFYHRLMGYFQGRNKEIASRCLDAGADVMSYGGNIASGKMISAEFFREFIFPYEKQLIGFIQSRGGRVLYHNCGYARNLLPVYIELGMRAYESLTPPPYGDTILDEAVEALGEVCALSGNVDQIDFLRRAGPAEIRERVREVVETVRGRAAFILATTDYLHEDTPHDNIHAFADAGRKLRSRNA